MDKITITQPDDWHIHLRDGEYLGFTVNDVALQFQRAIVMPNLSPPVTTTELALEYKQRILTALNSQHTFTPLMTLYLTDNISATTIKTAKAQNIAGCKLYPAGATTNSEYGVTDVKKIYPILAVMEECNLPLLIHGEIVDPNIDIFDREAEFIDQTLIDLHKQFPALRIVFEHITTKDAVDFVLSVPGNIGATITAHHLHINRNSIFNHGIRPDMYCLPVAKRNTHQEALIEAATSGNPKFFLGTDSAPHASQNKYTACGCAGIYTAHAAIELYTEIFEQTNALDKLEGFASHFGPDFYQLPRNKGTITLVKEAWQVPAHYAYGNDQVVPFRANETIQWKILP